MATKAKALHTTCKACGKPVTGLTATTTGVGGCCSKIVALRATGVTQWQHAIVMASVPTGFVALTGKVNPACKAAGVPVAHLVNATGKDRCMLPPMHAICTVVVVNGVRYVNGWLATKAGLQALSTYNFTHAPASNGL